MLVPSQIQKTSDFGTARTHRRPLLQMELEIGRPDDKYEKEADAIADKVMMQTDMEEEEMLQMRLSGVVDSLKMQTMNEEEEMLQMQSMEEEGVVQMHSSKKSANRLQMSPSVQMKCEYCEREEKNSRKPEIHRSGDGIQTASPDLANRIHSAKGGGRPLESGIQREMESKIVADFSGVNIHTGPASVQMSRELGANAFTVGKDIHFNRGQYDPHSSKGKHLLAHELTHVVQQNAGVNQYRDHNNGTISLRQSYCYNKYFESGIDTSSIHKHDSESIVNRQNDEKSDRQSLECPGYKPGEIRQSRTAEGHLISDVSWETIGGKPYIIVADYGVGQANMKSSARPFFQGWLDRFASRRSYQLRIEGHTDCVGNPESNTRLRYARASALKDLLDDETKVQSNIVDSGTGVYIRDNISVENRAVNRSVLIAVNVIDVPTEVVTARTTNEIVQDARSVHRQEATRSDDDWTFYGSLTMLLDPATDDEYIDGWDWQAYGADFAWNTKKNLRAEIQAAMNPSADASENYQSLLVLARQIEEGINFAASAWGGALADCQNRNILWIDERVNSSDSIYSTWKNFRPRRAQGRLTLHRGC